MLRHILTNLCRRVLRWHERPLAAKASWIANDVLSIGPAYDDGLAVELPDSRRLRVDRDNARELSWALAGYAEAGEFSRDVAVERAAAKLAEEAQRP